jgi:hypothetical protein
MKVQNFKARGSRYQEIFYGKKMESTEMLDFYSEEKKDPTMSEILNLMNNLNISDPKSQYSQNKAITKSGGNKMKLNVHQAYIHTYIHEIKSKIDLSSKFPRKSDDRTNLFWKHGYFRGILYNWMLGIVISLEIYRKVYFRAIMICDKYLIKHYQILWNEHSEKPEHFEFFLHLTAISCLFIACKYENPVPRPYGNFKQFIDKWFAEPRTILEFEENIFLTLDYNISFDTYIEVLEDEMIKNNYSSDNFGMLKMVCEYILLRTVLVDTDFLHIEIHLYCVSLLISGLTFLYDCYRRFLTQNNKPSNLKELERQKSLHTDSIRRNTTYEPSIVRSIESLIKEKLKRFEEDENMIDFQNISNAINLSPIFSEEDEF